MSLETVADLASDQGIIVVESLVTRMAGKEARTNLKQLDKFIAGKASTSILLTVPHPLFHNSIPCRAVLFSRQNIDTALLYLPALSAEVCISNIIVHLADFRVFHDGSSSER